MIINIKFTIKPIKHLKPQIVARKYSFGFNSSNTPSVQVKIQPRALMMYHEVLK